MRKYATPSRPRPDNHLSNRSFRHLREGPTRRSYANRHKHSTSSRLNSNLMPKRSRCPNSFGIASLVGRVFMLVRQGPLDSLHCRISVRSMSALAKSGRTQKEQMRRALRIADIPTPGLWCQCRRLEQRQHLPAPACRHHREWIGRHHRLCCERRMDCSVLDVNGRADRTGGDSGPCAR